MDDRLSVAVHPNALSLNSHAHERASEQFLELERVLSCFAIVARLYPDAHHDAVAGHCFSTLAFVCNRRLPRSLR